MGSRFLVWAGKTNTPFPRVTCSTLSYRKTVVRKFIRKKNGRVVDGWFFVLTFFSSPDLPSR